MKCLHVLLALSLLGGCVGTLSGCAGAKVVSSHAARTDADTQLLFRYYPLDVGNRWTYATDILGEKSERTVEIVGRDNGFFRDNEGGQLAIDGYGVRDRKRYLLRAPLETGHNWTNVVSPNSVEHYTLKEAGVVCEAPAGVFEDCIRVEAKNRMGDGEVMVSSFTFAPNVGLIRVDVRVDSKGRKIPQSSLVLKRYALRKRQ